MLYGLTYINLVEDEGEKYLIIQICEDDPYTPWSRFSERGYRMMKDES